MQDIVRHDNIELNGNQTINGDIISKSFTSNGIIYISGILDSFQIFIHGMLQASFVKSKEIKINGSMTVVNNLSSEIAIESNGSLTVETISDSDHININGAISGKDIRCKSIEISMHGESAVSELKSERILIKRQLENSGRFSGTSIYGTDTEIEYGIVDYIESETLIIGPGCMVKTVKAVHLTIDPSSTVTNVLN